MSVANLRTAAAFAAQPRRPALVGASLRSFVRTPAHAAEPRRPALIVVGAANDESAATVENRRGGQLCPWWACRVVFRQLWCGSCGGDLRSLFSILSTLCNWL